MIRHCYANVGGINQVRIQGIPAAQLISSETGEEIGVRQRLFDNRLSATLAVYNLVAQSETTYNADVGQDSAGAGSHRTGFEMTAADPSATVRPLCRSHSE